MLVALLATVLTIGLAPGQALAADPPCDTTWSGGNGNWGDGSHWSAGHQPTGTERACLPAGDYTVSVTSSAGVGGVTVAAGPTLSITTAYQYLSSTGTFINHGHVTLAADSTTLYASLVQNDGTIEDAGTISANAIPQINAPVANTGTLRANTSLRVWPNGGAFTNTAPGKLISNGMASLLQVWTAGAIDLASGTITNNGTVSLGGSTFHAGTVTGSGAPVELGNSWGTPMVLDLSGSGTLQMRVNAYLDLGGDIAPGMSVSIYGRGGQPGALRVNGDRVNRGAITLTSEGGNGQTAELGATGNFRLTNEGTIDVEAGAGGDRTISSLFTNAAVGTVNVDAAIALGIRNDGANSSAGTIAIAPTGSIWAGGDPNNQSFTQTAGTISGGGVLEQRNGRFTHAAGTVTGGSVVRLGNASVAPKLDPSGPGTAAYEIHTTADLIGDINAAATVDIVSDQASSYSQLRLTDNRTNAGTIRMRSVTAGYGVELTRTTATARLTNTGRLETRVGGGGDRNISVPITNAASGVIDVGPGVLTSLNQFADDFASTSAGTITIDPTGSFRVWGNPSSSFTQNGGTIDGDRFVQHSGTHVHQAGMVNGRLHLTTIGGNGAKLDAPGPGDPSFELRGTVGLVGGIGQGVKVYVHGGDGDWGQLDVQVPNAINSGLIRLEDTQGFGATVRGSGGTLTNNGTLEVAASPNNGGRELHGTITNNGTLTVAQSTVAINDADGTQPAIINRPGATAQINASVTVWGGYRQTGGTTTLAGGQLVIPRGCGNAPGCDVDIQAGVVRGSGDLVAPVVNGGTISPGTPAAPYGRINLLDYLEPQHNRATSYTQKAAGALSVGVGGRAAGQYDLLSVDGPATLAGELGLSTDPAFSPDPATPDRFPVLKAETRTGSFDPVTGDDRYTVEYDRPAPDAVVLKAVTPPPPAAKMSVEDGTVDEGDAGTRPLDFKVKLSTPAAGTVSARWETGDDTATAPSDYAASSGTVTFAAGQTETTISVPVAGDAVLEPAEQLLVRLSAPSGARLAVARATGTIRSDDLGVSGVRPAQVGDTGPATLALRGGGLGADTTVALRRAGQPDIAGTVRQAGADGASLLALFDLAGAARGVWDVVVTTPAPNPRTATLSSAVTIGAPSAPRLAVSVATPPSLRYGWVGTATVSLRNDGTSDADVDLLRVTGTGVKLRTDAMPDFADEVDLGDDALAAALGGAATVPAGETRSVAVRFMSTTLVAHADLRIDADVYPAGQLADLVGGTTPNAPDGRITGVVRDAAGDPVAGVRVAAAAAPSDSRSSAFRSASAITGANGSYTLAPLADAAYSVGIGREPSAAAQRVAVTVDAAHPAPTADLRGDVSTVAGRVRQSAGGAGIGGAEVSLLRGDDPVATTTADAGGAFAFTVLRSDTYTLIASTPAGGLARLDDVAVTAGTPRTGLTLVPGGRTLAVTVTKPGGGALAGATVTARPASAPQVGIPVLTGSDGVATFHGLPAGTTLTLDATADDLAPATTLAAANATTATLAMVAGGTLAGTVTATAGGAPIAHAGVIAVHHATGLRRSGIAESDGHYQLAGLPAGATDVWLVASGLAPKLLSANVSAGATTTLNGTLGAAGTTRTLSALAPGGGHVAGVNFAIRDAGTGALLRSVFAGRDGLASSGPLPDGAYDVTAYQPGVVPRTTRLTIGAGRGGTPLRASGDDDGASLDDGTSVDVGSSEPYADPEPRPGPLDDPPMITWSGLPEPQQTPWHRAGRQFDYTKIDFATPCPAGHRLKILISQQTTVLSRAWDAYYAAWDSIRLNDRVDVAGYLTKSADVGMRALQAAMALKYTLRGARFPGNPAAVAAVNNFVANVARYQQFAAEDRQANWADLAGLGQDTLGFLGSLEGGAGMSNAGVGSDFLSAWSSLRDFVNLADEVSKLPGDVKARGDAFREAEDHYLDTMRLIQQLTNQLRQVAAGCPDPTDDLQPPPGGHGGGITNNAAPGDPNDILGPVGVGAEGWIPAGQDLGYQVRFENLGPGSEHNPQNLPLATAPAVIVKIDSVLDGDVDLDAVELGDVGWGTTNVTVPAGRQSYHADVPSADGDIVRVDGRLDRATRTLHWTLQSIDPATGDVESSPTKGFLPPEDGTGIGQGYATYRARADAGVAHGAQIQAKASIVFDFNPVIDTPTHSNAIDKTAPSSAVTAASQPGAGSASCTEALDVAWSGSDAGAGVATYDVWVSADGGPFRPWKLGTTATSARYAPATSGHAYAFWSVARDRVGLAETPPAGGDVAKTVAVCDTTAPASVATIGGAAARDGWRDGPVDVRLDAIDAAGGLGVDQLVWASTGATPGGATVAGDTTTVRVDGEGVTEVTHHGRDKAGNRGAARTVTIRIDRRAPAIAIGTPGENATFTAGTAVTPAFACDDAGGSGVASCDGSAVDTSSPGTRTFTVVAVDRLGHRAQASRTYTVVPAPQGAGGQTGGAGPAAPAPGVSFRAKPVSVMVARQTSVGRVRITLRSLESFAITGRATLTGKLPKGKRATPLATAVTLSLKPKGSATLTLALTKATQKALRAGRAVPATLTLELRSGAVTKTMKVAVRLKRAAPAKRR